MLSCLDMGPSIVTNGEYAGKPLPEVIGVSPDWCGSNIEKYAEFPVLIKFIDAMDDETFAFYVKYHLHICERPDMIGATNHILDVFRKE